MERDLLLDTDRVDRRERAAYMSDILSTVSARCTFTHLVAPARVWGRIASTSLGGSATVLCAEGSAFRMSRLASHVGAFPAERVSFALGGTAGGATCQHSITHRLSRADLIVVDLTAPYDYRSGSGQRSAVEIDLADLGISVDVLRAAMPRLRASPMFGLVRDHVESLCQDPTTFSEGPAAADVLGASTALLGGLLLSAADADEREARAALEASLLPLIVRFARAHVGDPGLDAEAIAAAHGISAARLAAVWAPMGCDLAEWLDAEGQRSGITGEGA